MTHRKNGINLLFILINVESNQGMGPDHNESSLWPYHDCQRVSGKIWFGRDWLGFHLINISPS